MVHVQSTWTHPTADNADHGLCQPDLTLHLYCVLYEMALIEFMFCNKKISKILLNVCMTWIPGTIY